jgi:predicted ATPase
LQKPDSGNRLAVDGSNAASVLKRLFEVDKSRYQRVVQTMSQIVPSIQKIEIAPIEEGRSVTLSFDESFGSRRKCSFRAASMSDGTLQMLGILLAAYQEEALTLIGFEEPEVTVHPGVMAVLAEALQEAGLRVQVLVTTHSPDLITCFDTNALRVVERSTDGLTIIAPILESQLESIRERLFTAGEIHRIEGLRPSIKTSRE